MTHRIKHHTCTMYILELLSYSGRFWGRRLGEPHAFRPYNTRPICCPQIFVRPMPVGQKTAHGFHCNNFFLLSTNFHNFWHICTIGNLQLGGYIVSPPNTVCVTTLPCEILITILCMFVHDCYHKYIGNTKEIFTLDQINVSK